MTASSLMLLSATTGSAAGWTSACPSSTRPSPSRAASTAREPLGLGRRDPARRGAAPAGKYDEGRALLQHALKIYERTIGEKSASGPMQMLAMLEHDSGRFAEAGCSPHGPGAASPRCSGRATSSSRSSSSGRRCCSGAGEVAPALAHLRQSMTDGAAHVRVLSGGTEEDKRQFLENMSYQCTRCRAARAGRAQGPEGAPARPDHRAPSQGARARRARQRPRRAAQAPDPRRPRAARQARRRARQPGQARAQGAAEPAPEFVRQVADLEREVRDLSRRSAHAAPRCAPR